MFQTVEWTNCGLIQIFLSPGHGSLSSLASLGHFSTASLVSEEKTNLEIQKLRRELREEHEKVKRLQSQLSTNVNICLNVENSLSRSITSQPFQAHVVSAFEQSLANMTSRLSHLTLTAEEKVSFIMLEVANLHKY